MATRKQTNGAVRITDEMVRTFRWVMAIKEAGDDLEFEEDGGRRHEYLNVASRLHHDLLGLQPWDSPVTSDLAWKDPVTGPWLKALEEATERQESAGKPVKRPNLKGLC
jgi:hypothetical protein